MCLRICVFVFVCVNIVGCALYAVCVCVLCGEADGLRLLGGTPARQQAGMDGDEDGEKERERQED